MVGNIISVRRLDSRCAYVQSACTALRRGRSFLFLFGVLDSGGTSNVTTCLASRPGSVYPWIVSAAYPATKRCTRYCEWPWLLSSGT